VSTCSPWKPKKAVVPSQSRPNDPIRPSPGASERMARIRQAKTKPEKNVAAVLTRIALSYRRNVRSLPGSPDFANKRRRWAIFVNGCYWHHHTACKRGTTPKTNRAFWLTKFAANRQRDANAVVALRRLGFKVLVVWECEAELQEARLRQILESRGVQAR
jgi:DNA mismatch endonuclease Vsr